MLRFYFSLALKGEGLHPIISSFILYPSSVSYCQNRGNWTPPKVATGATMLVKKLSDAPALF
jgi:hypothetical protein